LNCFQQNNKLLYSNSGKCSCSNGSGINIKIETFNIFPNPTNDVFTIYNNFTEIYNVQVYNISGVLIKELYNCQNIINVDLSSYSNGIYVIKVFTTTFSIIRELVKN